MKDNYEKQILNHLLNGTDKNFVEVFRIIDVLDFGKYRTFADAIYRAWQDNQNPANKLFAEGFKVSEILDDSGFLTNKELVTVASKIKQINTVENIKEILSNTGKSLNRENLEEKLPELQQQLLNVSVDNSPEEAGIDKIIEEFREEQRLYEEKKKNGEKLLGLSTGVPKLDAVIDGLRPGHLWVLGGYTNTGKTFAAMNIIANLAKKQHRTVFFSLEMSRTDILARMLGVLSGQNGLDIKKGFDDKKKTDEALATAANSDFSVYSGNNDKDIATIVNTMHAECLKNKPALFVIDFIQLVQVKGTKSEYEAMTTAALALQTAGQKFGVPIIVLSQVSNDAAKAGDSQVMGFKGSGGIAAAADLAVELVSGESSVKDLKTKMMNGEPVLINWQVKKNRHGRVGTIDMEFTGKTGKFIEYEF